jgi:hypothetical protein
MSLNYGWGGGAELTPGYGTEWKEGRGKEEYKIKEMNRGKI